MKKMEYKTDLCREILDEDVYKGFKYIIYNLGLHPTAYVEIPKEHKGYRNPEIYKDVEVHGGITYDKNTLPMPDGSLREGHFIGWDYAHYNDFSGLYLNEDLSTTKLMQVIVEDSKKWTTEEILEDVKSVINQLI